MTCVAIIPARGGSKAIPRKNLYPLAGLPLVAHSIVAARAAARVDRVVVSTDDAEISGIARQYCAEVISRPAEISGDLVSSELSLLHVLETLERNENYLPELVCFLQCTAPLTTASDIDGGIDLLEHEEADSLLTVTPFYHFIWRRDDKGRPYGVNHDMFVRQVRQKQEPQYLETGAFYVMRTDGFRKHRHRFFGHIAIFQMPSERVLEIDGPGDLVLAEALMEHRLRTSNLRHLPARIGAVVCDFDGVFTDNRVLVFQDGKEAAFCDRGDGMGLELLRALDLPILVISKERSPIAETRCQKLGIPCISACDDKIRALTAWADDQGIELDDVIYVGNDINDIECLTAVGCGVVVGDAHPEAKLNSKVILTRPGGRGALRELCDIIAQRHLELADEETTFHPAQ